MEADGTYFSVQKAPEGIPSRIEVKALVTYERKESNREMPRKTREKSITNTKREQNKKKIMKELERKGLRVSQVAESVGAGYLPPHQVDTKKM